jgi:hypothetical protein
MKRIFAILTVLMITTNAYAYKKGGVDFEKINWAKLCPSVESVPMQFKYNSCPVVHPATDKFFTTGMGGPEREKRDCKGESIAYRELTRENRYGGWNHCKDVFQNQYAIMSIRIDNYSDDDVEMFRDKYLSEGVYDAAYVRNSRARLRADTARKKAGK